MNTNERLLRTPDRAFAPERDGMRKGATCRSITLQKRGPDPTEVPSRPATKKLAIRNWKADLPQVLANAILLGGDAFQKDRGCQIQWSSNLEELKPNGKALTVDQLFEAHGIYSRTSGLRSRQSSLVKCFLAVGSTKLACGEKTRRRLGLIGRLITDLVNLASVRYGEKAYSICVALTAAPEQKFSFGMEAMRSCSLNDVEGVINKVCAILENHPDAAWQNIDRKFAFDPARMISATDLSYAAARVRLGLTAPELLETSSKTDLLVQTSLAASEPAEGDHRLAIADLQYLQPMILQGEVPQDVYPTQLEHLTSQVCSHTQHGSEGRLFNAADSPHRPLDTRMQPANAFPNWRDAEPQSSTRSLTNMSVPVDAVVATVPMRHGAEPCYHNAESASVDIPGVWQAQSIGSAVVDMENQAYAAPINGQSSGTVPNQALLTGFNWNLPDPAVAAEPNWEWAFGVSAHYNTTGPDGYPAHNALTPITDPAWERAFGVLHDHTMATGMV
ncbi:hypothetical protein LTR56_027322 [Elasticomyces elasticus]|nr:hypothetical protein LTR56_027322 [Elasticomyces elasticus]KAK4898296.1 hypothetical protein LTR49_027853 [Elasticomyces elasticus]KAK5732632.1 hypothetical protein LTS12_027087 [Elasticomyces elasticus]